MNERVKKLTDEAIKLSPLERAELVEGILASLDKPDPEIDRAWGRLAEQRLDDYLSGKTTSKPAEEVLAKYLKP